MSPKRIGFIGLGNMGRGMAANLAAAGYAVHGYDLVPFDVAGVARADSAVAAASGADVLVTMLPDGASLHAVFAQVKDALAPGRVLIDCSTVDVDAARQVHDAAAAAGVLALDAPVSGGIGGAAAGTLTFMVGGSDAAFAEGLPLFEVMGQRAVHCGGAGTGQAAKICNNMLLGISMIGACEAFALGDKLGLDAGKLFDVVSTSSGACWAVNTYCPVPGVGPEAPSDKAYVPGFAAELMLKDLNLSQAAAAQAGAETPLGTHAAALYQALVQKLGAGHDFSILYRELTNQT